MIENFTLTPSPTDSVLNQRRLTISEFQRSIDEKQTEIDNLNDEIQSSEDSIYDINQNMNEARNNWNQRQVQLSDELETVSADLNISNETLQQMIQQSNNDRQSLQNDLNTLQNRVNQICEAQEPQEYQNYNNTLQNYRNQKDTVDQRRANATQQFQDTIYSDYLDDRNNKQSQRDAYVQDVENTHTTCVSTCNLEKENSLNNISPPLPVEPTQRPPEPYPNNLLTDIATTQNELDDMCRGIQQDERQELEQQMQELQNTIDANQQEIDSNNERIRTLTNNLNTAERNYSDNREAFEREIDEFEEQISDKINLRQRQRDIINHLRNDMKNVQDQIKNYENARDSLREFIKAEEERIQNRRELGLDDGDEDDVLRIKRWNFIWNSFTPEERIALGIPEFDPLNIPDLNLLDNIEQFNFNTINGLLDIRNKLGNVLGKADGIDFGSLYSNIKAPEINLSRIPTNINGLGFDDGKFRVGLNFGFGMRYSTLAIIIIVTIISIVVIRKFVFKG